MWFYNTYFNYKFTDIKNNLPNLKRDGIRVLGFFSPYYGDQKVCDGCDPVNFYTVPPQNGTLQDWKDLVAAAHRKGMKVVSYFVNIYMDSNSSYFRTAERQYAAGDRTSREVSSFAWTTNPQDPLPTLRSELRVRDACVQRKPDVPRGHAARWLEHGEPAPNLLPLDFRAA